MPIDRAATLRNAEKFLRQGKLDAAIAEYIRVVEDQPRDWNAANTLGDLYVRAGKVDKAVEQFIRIADSLNEEGFLPKAGAVYKKIIKLKPDDEHALLQAADIASSQGLFADARGHLNAVADRRRARNDVRGVAQIQIRLGSLDPNDYEARLLAASARVQVKDLAGAVDDLKGIAAELTEKGRTAEAIVALRDATALAPDDDGVRTRLLDVLVTAGDFAGARGCATTPDQFRALASALEARGHGDEAIEALREAARLAPEDADLRAQVARAFVARGDVQSAAEYLTIETAGSDPELLLTIAAVYLRGERVEDGLALLRRMLDEDPAQREQIALMAWTLAEHAPEAGFRAIEMAADASVALSDWASAAAALQEFVTRVPNHIPALMRLVEICVDGGLEATMYSAQAQLADAYLTAGAAAEALIIAEDLVAREPWERSNVERFRKALVLSGEPDPDALIAERLSGQSPFMSTDLSLGGDLPSFEPEEHAPAAFSNTDTASTAGASSSPDGEDSSPDTEPGADSDLNLGLSRRHEPASPQTPIAARHDVNFDMGANSIDLAGMFGDDDPPPASPAYSSSASPSQSSESVEVDLSIVLGGIKPGAAPMVGRSIGPAPAESAAQDRPPKGDDDLDGVFEHLRGEATRRSANDAAEQHYQEGLALQEAGDIDGAIESLTQASRAPRLRFQTASRLGRMNQARGQTAQAIEWFERAAEAPSPSPDESHALLYELADLLESTGETARALAICMELQSEIGDYRDVGARVDRLSKVQTRG